MHKAVPKYLKHVYRFLNNVQKALTKMRLGLRPFFLHIKWEHEKSPKYQKGIKNISAILHT